MKTADNGVDVESLHGSRSADRDAAGGAVHLARHLRWLGGVHSKSTVETFFGAGAEQSHKTPYSIEADHPAVFAAPDNGATPVEIVLSALASCLTAGVAAIAQNRGIQLHSVKARSRATSTCTASSASMPTSAMASAPSA